MSESPLSYEPYRVSYTERVRNSLRAMTARAIEHGLTKELYQALEALDRRLRTYPQFDEALQELKTGSSKLYVMTIAPLVVRYVIEEEKRVVMVASPIETLPNSGLDP